jgi:anti-anti-sigma factor
VEEFLGDGLATGARVCYVGAAPTEVLLDELHRIDGMEKALSRGAARVTSLTDTYMTTDTVVDPAAQVRAYAVATEEALAAGYTGLRVAAEATPMVRTPAQLAAFARYEHLVDRYMAEHAFSALCAYDVRELGDDAIAQLACLHPNTNLGTSGFRLHAAAGEDYSVTLNGELDLSTEDLFTTALERADLSPRGGELVVDATGLDFIDHRSVLRLLEHARSRAATLVLHTSHPCPTRMVELLGLADVRVESRLERTA